jgi:hypothetical protein
VLFIHETHSVRGASEDAFEEAVQEGWMSVLANTDVARLLWYCVQAHGTGPAPPRLEGAPAGSVVADAGGRARRCARRRGDSRADSLYGRHGMA